MSKFCPISHATVPSSYAIPKVGPQLQLSASDTRTELVFMQNRFSAGESHYKVLQEWKHDKAVLL